MEIRLPSHRSSQTLRRGPFIITKEQTIYCLSIKIMRQCVPSDLNSRNRLQLEVIMYGMILISHSRQTALHPAPTAQIHISWRYESAIITRSLTGRKLPGKVVPKAVLSCEVQAVLQAAYCSPEWVRFGHHQPALSFAPGFRQRIIIFSASTYIKPGDARWAEKVASINWISAAGQIV